MRFIKISLVVCLLCLWATNSSAKRSLEFGLKAGYNLSQHYGTKAGAENYEVDTHFRHAAGGGLFIYSPITEAFGIQQELLYVMKGSREDIVIKDQPIQVKVDYDMDYVEIPVLFKFQEHRFRKFSLYGFSGFALSIMVRARYKLVGTVEFNEGGNITIMPISARSKMPDTDIFDYAFLYGGGIDFQIRDLDLSFEYRFTIGWNPLLLPTFGNEDPVPLRNQSYLFMLGIKL